MTRNIALGETKAAEVVSTGHDIHLHEEKNVTLLMPLAGSIEVETGGRTLAASSGGAILLWPGYRATTVRPQSKNKYRALVALAPAARVGSRPAAGGVDLKGGASHPDIVGFRGFLDHVLREAALTSSPLARPSRQRAAEALMLDSFEALSTLGASQYGREASVGEAHVSLAEEIMRAHLDEPLTIGALAGMVGIGTRALQAAFAAHRGATPRGVLTEMRLDEAQRQLLSASPEETVTGIALDCGFTHLSRFADAYRRRFGELPSATLSRSRRA